MDWTTLAWIGLLVVLAFAMMRGCAGMGAGCGMGSRHPGRHGDNRQKHRDTGASGSGRAA
jgi:hypothetical protein